MRTHTIPLPTPCRIATVADAAALVADLIPAGGVPLRVLLSCAGAVLEVEVAG